MVYTIEFDEKEIGLLKKSINHCLETCRKGGSEEGCDDCKALEKVLGKLPQQRA